jgi:DNA (cytosine-5)-methyltransferase 1
LVRPKYVIVENVAAILDGERMGTFLGSLAAAGFDAEWDCLQAKEFGAPHKRDRFFALAYANEVMGDTRNRNHEPKAPIFAGSRREHAKFWKEATSPSCRVDDGVSAGLYADRVGGLGNAVVPQVAEWIGRRIIEADARMK